MLYGNGEITINLPCPVNKSGQKSWWERVWIKLWVKDFDKSALQFQRRSIICVSGLERPGFHHGKIMFNITIWYHTALTLSYIRMAVSTKNGSVGWIWLFLQKWSSCSKPPLSASNRFNNPNQHYITKTYKNGHVNQNWHWSMDTYYIDDFSSVTDWHCCDTSRWHTRWCVWYYVRYMLFFSLIDAKIKSAYSSTI